MRFLILGSKEYPLGSGLRHDPSPSGGMEKYVQELSDALRVQGQTVSIVTRRFEQKPLEDDRGIEVHRVGWMRGFFLRNPSFNLQAYLRARHIAYDVVISNGVMATLAALLLRRENQKPIIARPAGIAWVQPQYPHWAQTLLRHLEAFAYRHADAVVFPNAQEQDAFQHKMGFLPRRSVTIPTGINLEPYNKLTKSRKKSRRPKLVFVGRLQRVKGLTYLLDAMQEVDADLDVIGTGPQEAELKTLVQERKLTKKVRFLGNRSDVPRLLAHADGFVLPSLSEGLPIALLEAWAARLPCVVTDIGLPVRHGQDALVVPPRDAGALARAIQRVLNDTALARKLARNGRLRVQRDHSWKRAAHQYIQEAHHLCAAS